MQLWSSRSVMEEYGLPITQVQEIIRFSEPRSPPIRNRLDSRRDQPSWPHHPGVRLKLKLQLNARLRRESQMSRSKIVIVESHSGWAGLIVDGVNEGDDRDRGSARARRPARRSVTQRHRRRSTSG